MAALRRAVAWERGIMSEQKVKAKAAKKPKEEYGEPRPVGVAGPNASYVEKSLQRWRLRGDGVLASKR